ncbi:MAG TPA: hypothetical protein V6D29_21170 [Leptolyngbyaceae cyanobacterium]
MPVSVSFSSSFEPLAQAFRHYLKETNLYPRLTSLECHTQQGRLLVFAKHPIPQMGDPAGLLRELKTVFYEIMPEVGLPEGEWATLQEIPVRLGLQLEGEAAPYATHTFTWRVEDAVGVIFNAPLPEEFLTTESVVEQQAFPASLESSNSPGASAPDRTDEASVDKNEPDKATVEDSPGHSGAIAPFDDAAIALPETAVEPPAASWVQRWGQWGWGKVKQVTPYWSYGLAGLIVASSGLFAYTITRPCVVGSCDRIAKASGFETSALDQVRSNPTLADLQESRLDLQAAVDLVKPIPHWSRHYSQAQSDLGRYQNNLSALTYLLEAKGKAAVAAQKSQNPPHPVDRWTEVGHLWRQAVALLERVPHTSPLYGYAQAKRTEYQANADAIAHRITAEEEAEANLSSALQAAKLAQQRMETAGSMPSWQLATQQWQTAIRSLMLVPKGTEAYPEAQKYLAEYQRQLNQLQGQVNQEGNAGSTYQQARAAALQAEMYATQNQWTLAVAQWKVAVANIREVPFGSTLSEEAKALLPVYQASLANAQNRLQTAVALQTLQVKLGEVCQSSSTPCRVSVASDRIQVTLASQYALALEQAITLPSERPASQVTYRGDAKALIEQIIQMGNQVQRQIEIYDAQGGFVARYRPDLGGFTRD